MKSKNPVTLVRNVLITLYILVVLGFSATAKAENITFPIFTDHQQMQTQNYTGEIAMTVDGEFFLVVSEDKFFKLMSNSDLTEFNGQQVAVDGIELMHKVGPVLELQSVDPLPNSAQEKAAPVLVVIGISELTEK